MKCHNSRTDPFTFTTFYFNNADQVSGVVTPSPGGGQSAQVTTNYFDNMGRVWKTTLPDGTSVTNEFFTTGELRRTSGSRTYPVEYTYDGQGRMKTMKTWKDFAGNTGSATTTWNYDGYRGFLTNKVYDGSSPGPSYTYTAGGRLQTRAWARGVRTSYFYNNAGDLQMVDYSDSTPDVTYFYDRRGRPQIVTQGSNTCVYGYNNAGQLLSESTTGGVLNGLSLTNGYDVLLRRTNLVAQYSNTPLLQHSFGFDAASRLQTVSDGTNSATYSYLANSPLVENITFKQNGTTRMTTIKQFDNLNRLTSTSTLNAQQSALNSFNYAYNSANQRTAITNVDNSRWVYQYDSLGQVISGRKYWSDGTPVAGQQFEYGFDDIGNRKSTAVSGFDPWGVSLREARYTANSLNQYTSREVPGFVNVLGAANSNATITVNNQPTSRKGEYFRAEVSVDNMTAPLWLSLTNLAVLNNGTNADITTNITGNVFVPIATEACGYDADGNMTNDGRWSFTWDGENRLIGIQAISSVPNGAKKKLDFTYDYQGRRIQKIVSTWNGSAYEVVSTNKLLYDAWNLVAELNGTNGIIRSYVWGLDLSGTAQGAGGVGGLLTVKPTGDNPLFVTYDGNGNVAALIDATTGTTSSQYEYGPFGEVIRATGPMAKSNPFRFSTKYQDDETDFLYYGFRYYNPSTGRWLSRDPVGEQGRSNVYGFIANDGLNDIDLFGLSKRSDCIEATLKRYLFDVKQELRHYEIDRDTFVVYRADQLASDIQSKFYGDVLLTVGTAGIGSVVKGGAAIATAGRVRSSSRILQLTINAANAGEVDALAITRQAQLYSQAVGAQNLAVTLARAGAITGLAAYKALSANNAEDLTTAMLSAAGQIALPIESASIIKITDKLLGALVQSEESKVKSLEGEIPGTRLALRLFDQQLQKARQKYRDKLAACDKLCD